MARIRAAIIAAAVLAASTLALTSADAQVSRTRIHGDDRYDTAAELSFNTFSPGVDVAYLAAGDSFPDALSAGPAAGAADGPVLLTQKDIVPLPTLTELLRLDPATIIIVGGENTISSTAKTQVELAFGDATVLRVSGTDRYLTSAAVSAARFPIGVPVAYVATGESFPDALAGGAAGSAKGGPILLVEKGTIPNEVKGELDRLNPARIVVVGGENSVADTVLDELAPYSGDIDRIHGADRYATAALLSADTFPDGSPGGYIATGLNFPDALAGAAAARQAPIGPMLLATTTCIPQVTQAEILRLDTANGGSDVALIVLGGEATLTSEVLAGTICP